MAKGGDSSFGEAADAGVLIDTNRVAVSTSKAET